MSAPSTKRKVLLVGFDPKAVDFTTPDRVAMKATEEKVSEGLKAETERLTASGYDLDWCWLDLSDAGPGKVLERLKRHTYDCVLFGVGVRTRPEAVLLFEKIINIVHEHA